VNSPPPIGRPRPAVAALPAYRPGKSAAQAERDHGIVDAVKLASNETPWAPVAAVHDAVVAATAGVNRYADHRATQLRAALASRLGVAEPEVLVGCGSVGLLQQLFLTYVDPGDEVVYPWRSFEVYPVYTQLTGGVAVTPPLRHHRFDLDAVADAVTERTKLVLLAVPNNPTGTSVGVDDLATLLERVDPRTIVVIDEAYREFSRTPGDPIGDLLPDHRNVVVLRTFSKAHGLAGLRVGYGAADASVVEAVDKTLFPFAVNALAQTAALAALEPAADAEIRRRIDELLAGRDEVLSGVRDLGYESPDPDANFVWLPVGDAAEPLGVELERRGVVVRPFPGEGIRVTIGTVEQNRRFLAALGEVG